jgi:hypothetical protein
MGRTAAYTTQEKGTTVLKTFLYTLMAGSMLGTFGWMRAEVGQANSRPLVALPGPETSAVSPAQQRASATQTKELLAYVNCLRLDGAGVAAAWLGGAPSAPAIDVGRTALLGDLDVGMTRDDVRTLLGEPEAIGDEQKAWVYDVATVLFDEDGVAGWIETADETFLRRSMSDVFTMWESVVAAKPAAPRTRPQVVAPVAPAAPRSGGGYASGGYRRPLDQVLNRSRMGHGRYTNAYRKPSYLRNMFRSTSTSRRQRTLSPYDRYSY